MTVASRFQTLLARIAPTQKEIDQYASHLRTVAARLSNTFSGVTTKVIGSHARATAIRSRSDVDVLTAFPVEQLRYGGRIVSSDTALKNLSNTMKDRYTATAIRKDGQAVVLGFGQQGYSVDLVPAYFTGMTAQRRPKYAIPKGDGTWIETSPESHDVYIAGENQRAGGKLYGTARLLKYWRTCWASEIPLQSFHVELLLASSGLCVGAKGYAQCVSEAFDLLLQRRCRALQDPIGISGLIPVAGTKAKTTRTLAGVVGSAKASTAAVNAESLRQVSVAYRYWDKVFNSNFPSR